MVATYCFVPLLPSLSIPRVQPYVCVSKRYGIIFFELISCHTVVKYLFYVITIIVFWFLGLCYFILFLWAVIMMPLLIYWHLMSAVRASSLWVIQYSINTDTVMFANQSNFFSFLLGFLRSYRVLHLHFLYLVYFIIVSTFISALYFLFIVMVFVIFCFERIKRLHYSLVFFYFYILLLW